MVKSSHKGALAQWLLHDSNRNDAGQACGKKAAICHILSIDIIIIIIIITVLILAHNTFGKVSMDAL